MLRAFRVQTPPAVWYSNRLRRIGVAKLDIGLCGFGRSFIELTQLMGQRKIMDVFEDGDSQMADLEPNIQLGPLRRPARA